MLTWADEETFEIGGIEYACRPTGRRFKSEPGRFCLLKSRRDVEHYVALLQQLQPRRIVEIGTYDGGSSALFAEIARPEKIVTIDRRATPSKALTHFISTRGFQDIVSAYCMVDQGDGSRVRAVLHDAMPNQRIDLVVDDASHLVALTGATFNCLFPHLRPGGTYAIEDWSWAHTAPLGFWRNTDETPLSVLVIELILACASSPHVVSNVDVFGNIALITRGDATLDPTTFDVAACIDPKGAALMTALKSATDTRSINLTAIVPPASPRTNGAGRWSLAASVPPPLAGQGLGAPGREAVRQP